MLDAMSNVLLQNLLFDAPQGSSYSRDLRNDVDAVAVFLNHAGNAAHLSLDASEPLQTL